jgi:hypothetical protein
VITGHTLTVASAVAQSSKPDKRMVFAQIRLEDGATGEPVAKIWTTWILFG